jgi:hypothetical protein
MLNYNDLTFKLIVYGGLATVGAAMFLVGFVIGMAVV